MEKASYGAIIAPKEKDGDISVSVSCILGMSVCPSLCSFTPMYPWE